MNYWELLQQTSRTFYLSIRNLPAEAGNALCLAYLMLRVSDYLEDTQSLPPEEKVRLLNLWQAVIAGDASIAELEEAVRSTPANGEADYTAAASARQILHGLRQLPPELEDQIARHVRNSTDGMARWISRGPDVRTEADMDDYMHEVAGRVGYLSTEVFAFHSPLVRARMDRLMTVARETGLALQTVNIIRGLRKDFERGWIYVPESFCSREGITREQLFDPAHRDAAMQVLATLVAKAERHLQAAVRYILLLPRGAYRIRQACMWPILFAVRTVAFSCNNPGVFSGDVKVPRKEIKRIVRNSTLCGWSNTLLKCYARRLQRPPRTAG